MTLTRRALVASARAPDSRETHAAYLFIIKTARGQGRGDSYSLAATAPESEAFRLRDQGGCKMVRA